MAAERYTYDQLARRYCQRQDNTPAELLKALNAQKTQYNPTGWMLLEAQNFDSSYFGSLVIYPYGPNSTLKEIPDRPVSPQGLASDMSTAVAYVLAADLPAELPASLADWQPPVSPPEPKKKKRR